jgi:hypothetical protein
MLGVIVNILAALCGVMGILTATDVIEPLMTQMTYIFWFVLAVILFLSTIAFNSGRSE